MQKPYIDNRVDPHSFRQSDDRSSGRIEKAEEDTRRRRRRLRFIERTATAEALLS